MKQQCLITQKIDVGEPDDMCVCAHAAEDGYSRTFKTCGQHQKSTVQSAVQASARDSNDPVADHPAAVFEHSIEKKAGDVNEETSPSSKTLSLV
jgi:hypothetical protein